jgi:DNA sulfur modification protein DndC
MAASPQEIIREIQDLYLSDSMPWIIGYSGGKDSTASLQLIWNAITSLPEDRRRFKPIHVISTDTLVENPVIAAWVTFALKSIEFSAQTKRLLFYPHRLTPSLENRFWVNLIGKGYPAPRRRFRWCTDRLKISASTRFIQELSETNGEAILVLGQRRGESQVRDKVMDHYQGSTRERLSRNRDPKLSRVWVYLPIETWSSDDVWEYLMENDNPWGVSNQQLFDMYRGATPDAECPIVVDKSTPSCGDSRFGCYVCTMVSQDKSMQAMILNDESKSWMQPIMDFRDRYLAVPDHAFREFRRMSGRLTWEKEKGKLTPGPYTQERREELLRELLRTQVEVQRHAPANFPIELIGLDELQEIRRIWVEEKGEIEDRLPAVYEEVVREPFKGHELEVMPLDRQDLELLRTVASEWAAENLQLSGSDEEQMRGAIQTALEDTAAPPDQIEQQLNEGRLRLQAQRASELYKLARTLLASGFRGLQTRKRSKQLDHLQKLLSEYAFLDVQDAINFARTYLGDDIADGEVDVPEIVDDDLNTGELSNSARVIPIFDSSALLS